MGLSNKQKIRNDPRGSLHNPLYKNLIGSAATVIANVTSDKPFQILAAKINDHLVDLLPQKVSCNDSIQP